MCGSSDGALLLTIHVLSTSSDIVPLGTVSKEVLFSLKGMRVCVCVCVCVRAHVCECVQEVTFLNNPQLKCCGLHISSIEHHRRKAQDQTFTVVSLHEENLPSDLVGLIMDGNSLVDLGLGLD